MPHDMLYGITDMLYEMLCGETDTLYEVVYERTDMLYDMQYGMSCKTFIIFYPAMWMYSSRITGWPGGCTPAGPCQLSTLIP